MGKFTVDANTVQSYQARGAVLIPGLLSEWVDTISTGIQKNIDDPGPHAAENTTESDPGRFFDDYCNWQRIDEFRRVAFESSLAEVAASLMLSETVQLFHDHVLVKEAGTFKETPWHQDAPYYFVSGMQSVSFWCPFDPVRSASLRCVAGSHRWDKLVLPKRWLSDADFYADSNTFMPVPDPDAEGMDILEWSLEPGDVIAFHFRTLHGARGNTGLGRRRAFSLRFVGDDARYVSRPGPTSPPFSGHDMKNGDRLREDWFPIVYSVAA